jgi:glycosyltransferase involved in cell wall biosynthesis
LRAQAETTPGADVAFLGNLPPAAVRDEMTRAAVLAVPSIWPEVSPLVVLEAIDAGLPVVGSAIGGIPDLISEGRGVLVEPGNESAWSAALSGLVNDADARRACATRARAHAATEWTREKWWTRVQAAYAAAGAFV